MPENSETQAPPEAARPFVVGIKFYNSGKVIPFLAGEIPLMVGDHVVALTENGEDFGMVAVSKHRFFDRDRNPATLRPVIRAATPEDMEKVSRNRALEEEASRICQQKISERGLPMKLGCVRFSFDAQKATFYFTAEGRVDFRELVRDLAHHFKIKIEMKQIGVRDQARIIGGCGPCGEKLCCAAFLRDFEPVSIKMAKDQNLTLNPVKISGVCGRLMCCLVYEQEVYKELKGIMPVQGQKVMTKSGPATVERVHLLRQEVSVNYQADGKTEVLPVAEIAMEAREPEKEGGQEGEKGAKEPGKEPKPQEKKEKRERRRK